MSIVEKKATSIERKRITKMFLGCRKLLDVSFCTIRLSLYHNENPKILIVISKKVGNAPERNYVRRCIKEIYRKLFLYKYKKDIIFFYKAGKEICNFHSLEKVFLDFISLLQQKQS